MKTLYRFSLFGILLAAAPLAQAAKPLAIDCTPAALTVVEADIAETVPRAGERWS